MDFKETLLAACRQNAKELGVLKLEAKHVFLLACECHEACLPKSKAPRKVKEPSEAACLIYSEYPLKKSPVDAKLAIEKQLKKHSFEYLMERTKLFALAVASWPSSYRYHQQTKRDLVPYPATWFNNEAFTEDENEWKRHGARSPAFHQYIPPLEPLGWRDAFPDFVDRDKQWNQLQPAQHQFIIHTLSLSQQTTQIIHEDAHTVRLRTA